MDCGAGLSNAGLVIDPPGRGVDSTSGAAMVGAGTEDAGT